MRTDCDFLLDVLRDGDWKSLNEILRRSFAERGCGLTVHSRVSDLRARGHNIQHQTVGRRGDGSVYRLVAASGVPPNPPRDERAPDATSGPQQLVLVPDPPVRRGAYREEVA